MSLTTFSRIHRRAAVALFLSVVATTPRIVRAQVAAAGQGRETSAASVAQLPLDQDMPIDPEVLIGGLPNGLRFYIRPNPRPARQVELRLVVKAGSVLEDEDQRGLAHFVEHMQFEGSQHFPGQSIHAFLQSLGLNIGEDANAATRFDDTQYTLRVPSDRANALDTALTVLEDWAGGATFDPAGIDRQRPIVLAEWRRNLGADERTADKIREVQLEGSRYANRSPIGIPDVIQNATREQLLRFYRDWYRPNLMAVIVVGDVNREQVAAMIRQHFSGLRNPDNERPRPTYDAPEHPATKYAVVTDRESTNTVVSLSNLRPARNQGSIGGYRAILTDQLFAQMLGDRLDELTKTERPPFLNAGADRSLFPAPKTRDQATLQALVSSDGIARGLEALVTELQRVIAFGFTATELERAKLANLAGSERVVEESPDRESSSRADEYTRNFLQREALPTIWQELAFHRRFMPEITLAEMNALAGDWFPTDNRLVVVAAPEVTGTTLPSEATLAAAIATATNTRLTAYVDTGAGQALMDRAPAKGSITRTTVKGDVTEWTLSNGATVVLQPTTLKADQVLFRATAPGGTSLASDADFYSARAADDIVMASGIGKFSSGVLDKMLTGKAAVVRPFIGDVREGVAGGSTPRDLETMFQLIYLYFTAPRADPTAFAALKGQAVGVLANQQASPEVAFNQTIAAAVGNNHLRRQSETPDSVAKWNLDASMAFYKARFADAGNFTFVFVGSFTLDAIRPFVETYLASLPATRTHETWRDTGVRAPAGVTERTVRKGIAPRSEVSIVFTGPLTYDRTTLLALQTATLLLQGRLNDALREELGATYAITAESEVSRYPQPEYHVTIDWTCDPAQVEPTVQRVFREVDAVRRTPIANEQMGRIRDYLLRELDRASQDNAYLLNRLVMRYENGEPIVRGVVADETADINRLNGDAITSAALKYFDPSRYVRVTLMPEGR